ncbi:MAG: hypothetical protein Q4D19_00895 [Lautropia sp.]|nr:hypothetical protein [Lautropia sp.]
MRSSANFPATKAPHRVDFDGHIALEDNTGDKLLTNDDIRKAYLGV